MICQKCRRYFEPSDIEESHDVPCYLFEGMERRIRKNQADKYGRHNLCKKCHKNYELWLAMKLLSHLPQKIKDTLIPMAKAYSEQYFKKDGNDNTRSI